MQRRRPAPFHLLDGFAQRNAPHLAGLATTVPSNKIMRQSPCRFDGNGGMPAAAFSRPPGVKGSRSPISRFARAFSQITSVFQRLRRRNGGRRRRRFPFSPAKPRLPPIGPLKTGRKSAGARREISGKVIIYQYQTAPSGIDASAEPGFERDQHIRISRKTPAFDGLSATRDDDACLHQRATRVRSARAPQSPGGPTLRGNCPIRSAAARGYARRRRSPAAMRRRPAQAAHRASATRRRISEPPAQRKPALRAPATRHVER